jgi:Fe-S cluster assembly protein SufB
MLNKELVEKISKSKNEPKWMLEIRLKSFKIFEKMKMPNWSPKLSGLDLNKIKYYIDPKIKETNKWSDIPKDIKEQFDKLGIPESEKKALAGVGVQMESSVIYHNLKKELKELGVIFENMDTAVKKYPTLVKKYFMNRCCPINLHKFSALHGAVWSGGTFIYVPKNVKCELPLQAYFKMNMPGSGQFEHTLIIVDKNSELSYIEGCSSPRFNKNNLHAGCVEIFVMEGAKVNYSSVENWSKTTFNLNTKRALVFKNAEINWINGNMGGKTTMLYPASILLGENSKSFNLGIALANSTMNQDTGSKIIHIGKNTTSIIKSKSICLNGGISTYRGEIKIMKTATNSKVSVDCDSLMIDNKSKVFTYPQIKNETKNSTISHEAKVGSLENEKIEFLKLKGFSEEGAKQLLVMGYSNEIVKRLPLEYAAELNKLIELEIENSIC